mmetsp:Transcript_6165/g.11130  ORF Transcript_6165/g.11130 Transcript_6165/m.11130 type:complete len:235 (-) Transcript_6165:693-1397(-)
MSATRFSTTGSNGVWERSLGERPFRLRQGSALRKVRGFRYLHLSAAGDASVPRSSGGDFGDSNALRQPPSRQPRPGAASLDGSPSFDGSLSSMSVDALPALVDVNLPPPPDLHGKSSRARWNATHFAFMGDAVWELYMRRFFFHPPTRNTDYSNNVEGACRAEAQSEILTGLVDSCFLTTEEVDVIRWARNAKLQNFPKRFKAAGSAGEDGRAVYRDATCLETLVQQEAYLAHS